jgi:hypothetical protein
VFALKPTRAVIAEIQRTGAGTIKAIAQELEARGVRTPAGRDRGVPSKSPGCSQPRLPRAHIAQECRTTLYVSQA